MDTPCGSLTLRFSSVACRFRGDQSLPSHRPYCQVWPHAAESGPSPKRLSTNRISSGACQGAGVPAASQAMMGETISGPAG